MSRRVAPALAVAVLAVAAAVAAPTERWIHVKVESADGERVHVNVPLSLATEVLPLIHHDELRGGKIRIDLADAGDTDLKAVWAALAKAQDGRYVTVEGTEGNVKVAKSGGFVLVDVVETEDDAATVRVRVPVEVVDALFSAGHDELDLLAALEILGARGEGDLVTIDDGDDHVRVWIDAAPPVD